MTQLLLDKGADVNIQGEGLLDLARHHWNESEGGKYGTALQAAAASRQLEIVKLLLEHGADVNAHGENSFFFANIPGFNDLKPASLGLLCTRQHMRDVSKFSPYSSTMEPT
jgi:hypothetical protein